MFDAVGAWIAELPLLVVALAAGIAAGLGVVAGARLALRVAERLARTTSTELDDELLRRVRGPLSVVGVAVGFHVGARVLGVAWGVGAATLIETLVATYVAVTAFELLVVENWLERRQGLKVPGPVRQLVIAIAYGAVLLGIGGDLLGVDLTPLVATGSITSLVLGLALQQPLSNLFAGLVLHAERHPAVGDWLLVDGREGEVLEIGWRSTRLRTFSRDLLVVPNLSLLNAQVVNFAQVSPECGRPVPVPVPLDVPPHVFERWAREVLGRIEGVVGADEPRTKVWLTAIDDHCQRYVVRFWVSEFRIHDDCESELLKGLWYKFAEHGVAFPAPFQAVKVVDQVAPAMAALDPSRRGPLA